MQQRFAQRRRRKMAEFLIFDKRFLIYFVSVCKICGSTDCCFELSCFVASSGVLASVGKSEGEKLGKENRGESVRLFRITYFINHNT